MTIPNGAMDTATFDTSSITAISLSANVTLDQALFDSTADAFTITANLGGFDFRGAGVTNNSGVTQNFSTSNVIQFHNSSTAGNLTTYTNTGSGSIQFWDTSTGGTASLVNASASASIDISEVTTANLTVGSIAGNGAIYLGTNNLTVGTNNTSTTFSGVIQDGGLSGGLEGQLTKAGTGTLTLTGANTYTGGTFVNGGTLNISTSGSISSSEDFIAGDGSGSTGMVNATAGGTVANLNGIIGQSGGTGTVMIDGAGSKWTNSQSLDVGESGGTGTLQITNGGKVSNQNANIGNVGTGMVTVDGAGSTWTNRNLNVGNGAGAMGTLTVTNGATVSDRNADIGNSATGAVTVDGAGSTWTSSNTLTVGDSGPGTLGITNGGKVSAAGGTSINDQGTVTDNSLLVSPTVAITSGGALKGLGLIKGDDLGASSAVTNDGVVSPGDGASLGTLHLTGSYVQNADGKFNIAIGSLAFYDKFQISDTAMLDGTLDVTLDGYTGSAGDVFTILTSSGLTGNFSSILLPSLSDGLYFTESTDLNNVYLTVNSSAVPEPSTWTAGLLVSATLLSSMAARVRRRRHLILK
jgi:T5SS/PEP-CTERM-associated repeat protein/autotransporter-associated beta strand protein